MKKTIYDCWHCRHHNDDNPYGIEYCERHETRCSFAVGDCDEFDEAGGDESRDRHRDHCANAAKRGWLSVLAMIVTIAIALLLCGLLSGCATTRYVPVIEHRTDTLRQTIVQHDSIHVHDSITTTEKQTGDTIRITTDRWHTRYVVREVHDTTYVSKRDSVPVPYEVVREVAAPLSRTQQGLQLLGVLALIGGIIFAAVKIRRYLP